MAEKLKVVWLSNIIFPDAAERIGVARYAIGSWLTAYRDVMRKYHGDDMMLHVIAPYDGHSFAELTVGDTYHYLFPRSCRANELSVWLKALDSRINPDVVHLHGSEFPHSSLYIDACGNGNAVLSIQGLISTCASYYLAGLPSHYMPTLRDLLKRDTLLDQRREMARRGRLERSLLTKVRYVAGRTSWDYAHCKAVNQSLHYFVCNEPLREGFYRAAWSLPACRRHTVFACQSSYPLKGLHMLLRALAIVRHTYPDAVLSLPGVDLTRRPWYRTSTYWKYIRSLIRDLGLSGCVHFLGDLSEEEMIDQYLSANVFVCPSSIENSSNSVCEAQMTGTPVIASYVGGMMDLVDDGVTGLLYRFEEIEMLADKICRIFADDDLAVTLSRNARAAASVRHDREAIARSLWQIYQTVSGNVNQDRQQ